MANLFKVNVRRTDWLSRGPWQVTLTIGIGENLRRRCLTGSGKDGKALDRIYRLIYKSVNTTNVSCIIH